MVYWNKISPQWDFEEIQNYVFKYFCVNISTFDMHQNAEVHRSVKPPILSTIGDIALAIGPEFKNYLGFVCQILQQASQMAAPDKVND